MLFVSLGDNKFYCSPEGKAIMFGVPFGIFVFSALLQWFIFNNVAYTTFNKAIGNHIAYDHKNVQKIDSA